MLLVAWSEGVGTSFVGGWDKEKAKELLGIPQDMEFITVMPYGYPTEAAKSRRQEEEAASGNHPQRAVRPDVGGPMTRLSYGSIRRAPTCKNPICVSR